MGKGWMTMRLIVLILLVLSLVLLWKNRGNLCAAIGRFRYATGHAEEGLSWFRRGEKIGKVKFEFRLLHAYLTLKEGDVDEAYKLFNLLAMEKLTPEQRLRLKGSHALLYWKMGEVQDAVEMLEQVHENAKNTSTYGSLGYMYAYSGNLQKALSYNLEAYDYNSDDAIIVDNLAYTYLKLGDFAHAEEFYSKLFDMNPTFPEGYLEYGKHLVAQGQREQGLELVKKALNCRFSFLSMQTRRDILDYLEQQGEDITAL